MQFSIRWLMLVIAGIALLSTMFLVLRDAPAFWALLVTTMLVPSLAIPVIVYGRDDLRAFAIGVVSSFGLTPFAFLIAPMALLSGRPRVVLVGPPSSEMLTWKVLFFLMLCSALCIGLASVHIRHWSVRERSVKPQLPPPPEP